MSFDVKRLERSAALNIMGTRIISAWRVQYADSVQHKSFPVGLYQIHAHDGYAYALEGAHTSISASNCLRIDEGDFFVWESTPEQKNLTVKSMESGGEVRVVHVGKV